MKTIINSINAKLAEKHSNLVVNVDANNTCTISATGNLIRFEFQNEKIKVIKLDIAGTSYSVPMTITIEKLMSYIDMIDFSKLNLLIAEEFNLMISSENGVKKLNIENIIFDKNYLHRILLTLPVGYYTISIDCFGAFFPAPINYKSRGTTANLKNTKTFVYDYMIDEDVNELKQMIEKYIIECFAFANHYELNKITVKSLGIDKQIKVKVPNSTKDVYNSILKSHFFKNELLPKIN